MGIIIFISCLTPFYHVCNQNILPFWARRTWWDNGCLMNSFNPCVTWPCITLSVFLNGRLFREKRVGLTWLLIFFVMFDGVILSSYNKASTKKITSCYFEQKELNIWWFPVQNCENLLHFLVLPCHKLNIFESQAVPAKTGHLLASWCTL